MREEIKVNIKEEFFILLISIFQNLPQIFSIVTKINNNLLSTSSRLATNITCKVFFFRLFYYYFLSSIIFIHFAPEYHTCTSRNILRRKKKMDDETDKLFWWLPLEFILFGIYLAYLVNICKVQMEYKSTNIYILFSI